MKSEDSFSFLGLLLAVVSALSVYWVGKMLRDYIGYWPASLVLGSILGFLIWMCIKREKAKENLD